jgi:lipid A 3-O-deacylase
MKTKHLLSASLVLLSWLNPAFANDGWEGRILSVSWENDAIDGTDKHYTQGARIDYLSADNTLPHWLRNFSSVLPAVGYEVNAQKYGLGCGQEIYTPEDLDNPNPIPKDRPYAGWLYARALLQRRGKAQLGLLTRETLNLDLGVVGPESLAEQTQKEWHSRAPKGWQHQLRTEVAFVLNYRREYLAAFRSAENGWGFDFIPFIGGAAGTLQTFLNAGTTLRGGYHMPNEFAVGTEASTWGGYVFAGVDGRAVARNIFLDGNTFAHSQHVWKEPIAGEFIAGLTLAFKNFEATLSHTLRSREFTSQQSTDSFGAATLRIKF